MLGNAKQGMPALPDFRHSRLYRATRTMLKDIDVKDLKVGMYIQDLGRSWFNHPFTSSHFMVNSAVQLKQIREAGIRSIVIDTDKSEPIAPSNGRQADCDKEAQQVLQDSLDPDTEPLQYGQIPLEEELGRAASIKTEATRILADLMADIRNGKKIQVKALNPVVEDIISSVFRNQNALIGLMRIRRKDRYTYEHSVSTAVLLAAFGQHLGMNEDDLVEVGLGGLLMDIGKVRIPPGILGKPGKLNAQELALMHRHVEYGREILKDTPDIPPIAMDIVTDHHERLDGSGYPDGKAGDDISFYGMMAAIVDFYDAISTRRVYREGISPHAALKMLVERKNRDFHAELVYNFVHCVGVYPIGTLVQLSDGRFAVVQDPKPPSDAHSPLPRVRVIYDMMSRRYLPPKDLDLAHQGNNKPVAIVGAQEPEKWHITPESFLDHAKY